MKRFAIPLLLSYTLTQANPPPAECVAASKALADWIVQQHGQIKLSEMETSPLADHVRMACDGTPQAYEKNLSQIMQQWQPIPAKTETFTLSEAAQNMLAMALIIGLGAASSSVLVGIYQGAAGIAILRDYPE